MSILHKKLINMLLFSDCKRDIIKEENKSENGGNHYGNFSYRRRGFIGSHTVVELQNAGYDVVVVDNLSNASVKSLQRVEKITGKPVTFYKADILDREALEKIFDEQQIDSCIHLPD